MGWRRKRENGEAEGEDLKMQVPLVTRMEGQNWQMTAGAVVVNALLLTLLQFDGADAWSLLPNEYEADGWKQAIYQLAFIIVQGLLAGLVTAAALNMNFMPPGSRNWRWRALLSTIGLVLLNMGVLSQASTSIIAAASNNGDRSWSSQGAHFLLIFATLVIMFMVDFYHVKLFGCCECGCCSCCCAKRVPKALRSQQAGESSQKMDSGEGSDSLARNQAPKVADMQYGSGTNDATGRNSHGEDVEGAAGAACQYGREISPMGGALSQELSHNVPKGPNTGTAAGGQPVRPMRRWETRVLVERWEGHVHTTVVPRLTRTAAKARREGDQAANPLSALRPGAVWRSLLRALRRGWNAVKEEEGRFHYSVWVKAAVITSLLVQVFFCIKTVEFWHEAVGRWQTIELSVRASLEGISDTVTALAEVIDERASASGNGTFGQATQAAGDAVTGRLDGAASGLDTAAVRADGRDLGAVSVGGVVFLYTGGTVRDIMTYVTTFIPKFRVAVFVGYPLALMIGFWTVHVVLAAHKRMFLFLEREAELRPSEGGEGERATAAGGDTWLGIERKYPIGGAVYFFGVLTSTAILQIEIFGFLISLVLGVLGNIAHFEVLLDIFGFWLVAVLGAVFINTTAVMLFGNRIFSDGLNVHKPQLFFLYMFAFSMVHLVLGIFHAVVRMVVLTLTTLLILNRLDFTPFATLKFLDGGHNAFMSMLVLAQVIQRDKQAPRAGSGSTEEEKEPGQRP